MEKRTQPTETEKALQSLLKKERRRVKQLQAQLKYHKRAFRTLATKVTAKAAGDFAALCKEKNTTVHAALKAYTERATDEGELLLW
jgi:hypothetical protein